MTPPPGEAQRSLGHLPSLPFSHFYIFQSKCLYCFMSDSSLKTRISQNMCGPGSCSGDRSCIPCPPRPRPPSAPRVLILFFTSSWSWEVDCEAIDSADLYHFLKASPVSAPHSGRISQVSLPNHEFRLQPRPFCFSPGRVFMLYMLHMRV